MVGVGVGGGQVALVEVFLGAGDLTGARQGGEGVGNRGDLLAAAGTHVDPDQGCVDLGLAVGGKFAADAVGLGADTAEVIAGRVV